MRASLFSCAAEEPDAFDEDFNESESEDEDDEGKEETRLRKHERAAKVQYSSVERRTDTPETLVAPAARAVALF